jgi:hypothetical protein
MDLAKYLRVTWRFKWLLAGGFVLAVLLAVLAVARVSSSGITYRQGMTYRSSATIFITQAGFPWGRTAPEYLPGNQAKSTPSVPVADPQRLSSLTALYAQLAMSDPVRSLLTATERTQGSVSVSAVLAPLNSSPPILPLLRFSAVAPSKARAVALVDNAAGAFQTWLSQQQNSAGIGASQRVVAQLVTGGSNPTTASHRSKALPMIIFIAVIAASFGLALALENLRPLRPTAAVSTNAKRRQPEVALTMESAVQAIDTQGRALAGRRTGSGSGT